jgi:hypothetical protein
MARAPFGCRFRAALMTMLLAIATAGVVLAPHAAAAVHVEQYIEVPQCQPATTQNCPQVPTVNFTAADQNDRDVEATFAANANHCSDIQVRFLLHHYPVGDWMQDGPSHTVSVKFLANTGDNVLGVQARGVTGGCNTGSLSAWGGVVHVDSADSADSVGPSPNHVPCKWRYNDALVFDQDNGYRVHLDQWHDLTAMGPAQLYPAGATAPSERGVVLGAGPNDNGNPNDLAFSIAWFDAKNNHVATGNYDGEIDPQGTLRGTTVSNSGDKSNWVAREHFTCS